MLAGEVEVEPPLADDYRGRLAALEPSAGLCIEMGLGRPVTGDGRIVFSVDPPALIWAVSSISPEVAPAGKQLLQFFSPLDHEQREDRQLVAERETALADLGSRVYGRALDEDWRRVMVTTVGGVVPIVSQSRPHRPAIQVPGYQGLFLIGDGVDAPGLGGDLAARSALMVYRGRT